MKKYIIILLALVPIFITCVKREWANPFDSACPKEMWTPTNFTAVQNGTSVTLSWTQPLNNISGFKLTKKVDTGGTADLTPQAKGITTLTDPSLAGGKLHTYTLVAYAGNNQSNVVTTTVTPILAAGGITTIAAASITAVSAISGAYITTDGGSTIIARGVCWANSSGPTIAGTRTTDGTGTGSFTSSISGLVANSPYYVRAYATNSVGTVYGNEVSFRTLTGVSTINTTIASNITAITATSGGNITADGGAPITARGTCWGTTTGPTVTGSKTNDGTGIGSFNSLLTGLSPNTTYFVRTYATNSTGTTYGNEVTFKTLTGISILTTLGISNITTSTATSGGIISTDGGASITARGVCWGATTSPTIAGNKTIDGSGIGTYTSSITSLNPGITYYIRSYATNSFGTTYGNEITFKTVAVLPTISTSDIISTTFNAVKISGTISTDGGSFITARGFCYGTSHNPTIANNKTTSGTGAGNFNDSIIGLSNNITYYLRVYATNSIGTVYGNELSVILFMNIADANVSDIDGNVYKTVKIGSQTWMTSNLKVTIYRNGNTIPNVTDNTTWASLRSGARCDWINDPSYGVIYGHLYNYYSVIDSRQICPTGWHVPSDTEWTTLSNYLGGKDIAGGKMKETGTIHWRSPNTGATNSSGFNAIGGGWRGEDGPFYYWHNSSNNWWSTTSAAYNATWHYGVGFDTEELSRGWGTYFLNAAGISIRCIKD